MVRKLAALTFLHMSLPACRKPGCCRERGFYRINLPKFTSFNLEISEFISLRKRFVSGTRPQIADGADARSHSGLSWSLPSLALAFTEISFAIGNYAGHHW